MNHFFLAETQFFRKRVKFPPQIAHQIMHVLRMKNGDQVIVLDGQGYEYRVKLLIDHDQKVVEGDILQKIISDREPKTKLSLCFGLSHRDKVEIILQKGTEIGISEFYPFTSSRTLVQTANLDKKRIKRWERIIREAAEQSRRGKCPVLNQTLTIRECCEHIVPDHQLSLAAWEDEEPLILKLSNLLDGNKGSSIALFIGPEGGFSQDEIEQLKATGVNTVSLGRRILRMETAAIVFPALVLHELGEM